MKVTNLIMVNLMNTLESFSSKKLPQRISYAITKNLMIISKEYKCYETELRKLFDSYHDYILKNEDGSIVMDDSGIPVICDESKNRFQKDLNELLYIEVDLNLYKIPLSLLDYDDVEGKYDALSAMDILNLQSIICNENEDNLTE